TIDWMARLKGVAFDREYMQLAVMDEHSMRDEFRVEAEKGQVPALKGLAQTWLPTLENDLQDGVCARLQRSSAHASEFTLPIAPGKPAKKIGAVKGPLWVSSAPVEAVRHPHSAFYGPAKPQVARRLLRNIDRDDRAPLRALPAR